MSIRKTFALTLAALSVAGSAAAAPRDLSKDECVEAHGRGQDLRDRGQLARARQAFLTCAQSSCPGLVQADCARFAEELAHLVPTVTFSARDLGAGDLPNTTVYVDEVLITTRLDDGKVYEVDPGRHNVRYVHDGKEASLKVVVNQGEKGRLLVATFVDETPKYDAPYVAESAGTTRSVLPLIVAGLGAATAIGGGALVGVGLERVPDACTVSTRECATAPNDPSIERAESGLSLANTGIAVGIAGAVVLVGGLVWYFVQPSGSATTRRGQLRGPAFTF